MTPSRLATTALVLAMLAEGATAAAQAAKPQTARPPAAKTQPAMPPASAADESREMNLRAYVELLRSDVRSEKIAIMSEMMEFTEDQDAKFWPIYRDYDTELSKINDKRVALIKDYADNFENMTDAVADRIAKGALDLEAERHALKMKYYDRVKSALSPLIAARFLQVENQLLMLIDLQISAALPVVR